jgi:hypothetical protein
LKCGEGIIVEVVVGKTARKLLNVVLLLKNICIRTKQTEMKRTRTPPITINVIFRCFFRNPGSLNWVFG